MANQSDSGRFRVQYPLTATTTGPAMPPAELPLPDDSELLLRQAAQCYRESFGALLNKHRDRLVRMVSLRLDHRLRGRLDPSDVVQEACLEATARLQEYLAKPDIPFFLWLRFLTGQRVSILHRHHLGVHMRAAGREVPIDLLGAPATTSAALADCLAGHDPRPSEVAVHAETKRIYERVLESLDPIDREVLALRHVEQLSNVETAKVLNLKESAASKRYIRAIERLREALDESAGAAP